MTQRGVRTVEQKALLKRMVDIIALFAFFLGLTAFLISSEAMRRTNQRSLHLEAQTRRAMQRIGELESEVAALRRRQVRRQETLIALERQSRHDETSDELGHEEYVSSPVRASQQRYVPSQFLDTRPRHAG